MTDRPMHLGPLDGIELWSFIPPNFLPRLQYVAHSTNPSMLGHQYFVDGPVTVADAWLGTGDGTQKSPADWKTLLIFGEGRGGEYHSLELLAFL